MADLLDEILGWRFDGRPIWLLSGADGEGDGGEGDGGEGSGSGEGDGGEGDGAGSGADGEAAKWKALARKHENAAKAAQKRISDMENAGKSELEKAQGSASEATKRAEAAEAKALRYEVAAKKGLPAGMALRLVGSNEEELEADADELLKQLGKPAGTDGGSGGEGSRKPKERLRSGAANDSGDEKEPSAKDLVEAMPRR